MASNDFYTAKQTKYRKCNNNLTRSLIELTTVGQNTSISRINKKLASFDTWDASSIGTRHVLLMDLAQDIWKTTLIDV